MGSFQVKICMLSGWPAWPGSGRAEAGRLGQVAGQPRVRPGCGRAGAGPLGRLASLHASLGRVEAGLWPAGSGTYPARPGLGRA